MSDITISLPKEVNGYVICSTRIRHILAIRKSILMQIYMLFRQQAGISALRQELELKTPYRAMNHPVIGVVTKADLASMEHISLVKCWLREAGAHNVLVTSAVNNNGVTELFSLLHTEDVCR
ncbi:EutP/PduV family microcompartment system protein [Escherichia coli]